MLDHEKIEIIKQMCEVYLQQRTTKLYTVEETSIPQLAQTTFNQIEEFIGENSNKMVHVKMYKSMKELMEDIEREKQMEKR